MTIENLGVKLYSGTKQERKSDSLGSSADGTNTGITLMTTSGTESQSGTGENKGLGQSMTGGNATKMGFTVATGHALVGTTATKISLYLWKDGSPTGNGSMKIYNSSGTLQATSTNTVSWSGLGSSSWGNKTDFTFTGHILANGDRMVIEGGTTNDSNRVFASMNTGTASNTETVYYSDTWRTISNAMKFDVEYTDSDAVKLGTGAYEFAGTTSSYVDIGSGSQFPQGAAARTITAWFKTSESNNDVRAICGWGSSSTAAAYVIGLYTNSGIFITGYSSPQWTSGSGYADGNWHHLATTYDGTTHKIYVDGTEIDSRSATFNTGGSNNGKIGVSAHATSENFDGEIDDVSIWNRVLTTTEIEKLVANNQLATSGWTLQSGTSSDININSTSAGKLYFDLDAVSGSDQRMTYDLGSALSDTQWTMRFTVNTTSMANYSQTFLMLGDGVGGSATGSIDSLGFSVYKGSSTINHRLLCNNGTDALTVGIISDTYSAGVSNGTDYFIEINRTASDSAEMKIRTGSHSGTLLSTETITPSSTTGLRYLKCMNLQVSGWGGASVGTFDDIKIWNGTNTTSGTPDYSFTFTNGDAQLVSSLTNKSELKAYYSMDTITTINGSPIMNILAYSGATNFLHVGDSYKTRGEKINASDSALVGYKVSSVTVTIKDYDGNGLTGNLTCTILDSSGNAVSGDSFTPYNTAGLTSTESDVTFTNSNPTRVLQDDDSIALYYNGDATHRVGFKRSDAGDAFDGTKTCRAYRTGTSGALGVEDTEDQIMKIVPAVDGCKNDYSATSDLEALTGVRVNSIFQQTDVPEYYWYQSDGTWKLDGTTKVHTATGNGLYCGGAGSLTNNTSTATNYVWATDSANLPNNLGYSAGGGYKSSFMACGGYISSGNYFDSSTIWNGSAWATAVALDTQRRDTTAYGGNTASAVIALGRNNAGTEIDSSSKWNGTTWSSAGAIGANRVGEHVAGDGNDVSMLITGGSSTYRDNYADKWNGTAWSATTNIPSNMTSHNQAGATSESAHIAGGGVAWAGDWDGTTWTQTTTITQGSDSTPRYVSGGGTKDSHWVMCGLDGGTSMNNCTLWNGSSWTAQGNMTEAQYGGLGDGTIRSS